MSIQRDFSDYPAPHHGYSSLTEFCAQPTASGTHSISYGAGFLDLLVEDRQSETTIVMFHAAVLQDFDALPMFVGIRVTQNVDANLVFISDPTLELGTNLGWFGGDKNRPLQRDLPRVLSHVFESLTRHRYSAFFGPSGGGFAALYYSHRFPGSLAVPMNPQTDITRYAESAVNAYADVAWGEQLDRAPMTHEIESLYGDEFPNHVVYIQNLGDSSHVKKYLAPFLDSTERDRTKLSLLLGKWGKGHKPAPSKVLVPLLKRIPGVEGRWDDLASEFNLDRESTSEQVLRRSRSYLSLLKDA